MFDAPLHIRIARLAALLALTFGLACGADPEPAPERTAEPARPLAGSVLRLAEHADAASIELPERSIAHDLEAQLASSGFRVRGEALEGPCSESIVFPALRLSWWLCRTRYPVDVGGRSEFRAMTAEGNEASSNDGFAVMRAGALLPRGAIRDAEVLDTWIPTRRGISLPVPDAASSESVLADLVVDYPVDPTFVRDLDPSRAASPAEFVARNVQIGGDLRPSLYLPAGSRASFSLVLPENARLSTAVGVLEEGWPLGGAARFEISASLPGGESELLFSKRVDAAARARDRRWHDVQLDLSPWSGQAVELVFETRAKEDGSADFGFAAFGAPVVYARPEAPTPVVILNLDTLRPDHLEIYGYERDTSPALSALARDAVVFEQAIAQGPWTLPSQMSMLTGLYPAGHGVRGLDQRLSSEIDTLGRLLGRAGYLTRAIGDAGAMSPEFGFAHGFDSYWMTERHRHDYLPDLMRRFRQWFDLWTPENFLLMIHTYEPHEPYAPPIDDLEHFDHGYTGTVFERFSYRGGTTDFEASERETEHLVARYDGEIRYTDRMVGEVLDLLRARGLYDRALVVVLSDHGEEFGEHGGFLHGHSFYDELLRVPLVVKFPGSFGLTGRVEGQVALVDVLPTILSALGLPIPETLDGRDLLPIVRGDANGRRFVISDQLGAQAVAVRAPDAKLVQRGAERRFYALDVDPGETEDRFDPDHPRVRELARELDAYLARSAAADKTQARDGPTPEVENQLRALGYLE